MPEIELRLYGALRRYRPAGGPEVSALALEVAPGDTIADLIQRLGIPPSWVRSAFVNGALARRDRALVAGDRVALFPPAGGGVQGTEYRVQST